MANHHRRQARLEAVALGLVAGAQSEHLHRHHGAAMQRQQAVRRPHKMHAAPARQLAIGLQLVAHHLRDRQFGQRLFQRFLQAAVQGRTRGQAVIKQGLALAVGCAAQRCHCRGRVRQVGPQRLQLFEQGGCRLPVGVQADADGHQFLRHRLVRRLAPDLADVRRQPARRRKWCHHRLGGGQPLGPQLCRHFLGKGVAQFLERLGRQLFHKQFH